MNETQLTDAELARLEELAGKATPGKWSTTDYTGPDVLITAMFEGIPYSVWNRGTNARKEDLEYIAAACNAVPALVAEVRRMRAEAKQGGIDYCALMDRHDAQFVRAEDLKKQVEDLQWFVECFDNCKQRGKLPFEVHKTPSAYSEAWASLWAAREAVHADRE